MRKAGLCTLRGTSLFLAACAWVWTGSGPHQPAAFAQEAAGSGVTLRPRLSLEETFTDNALLTEAGRRRSDAITRGSLGVTIDVDHGALKAELGGEVAYDAYARSSALSGWSYSGHVSSGYAIVPERLTFEVEGSLQNEQVSTFMASAADRSGTPGRTELAVYYLGPTFRTRIADAADFSGSIKAGQVLYSPADASTVEQLPSDTTMVHAVVDIDTGGERQPYQLVTTAQFSGDDSDFRSGQAVQSVFVRVKPGVRLIARAGYERIHQPRVINLAAPILSVGLEFRPNAESRISLEGGTRYDRGAWEANVDLRLAGRLALTGRYIESVTPDQLYVANAYSTFVSQTAAFPPPLTNREFRVQENLYDQTSYNKRADLQLTYVTPVHRLDLGASWSDRRFIVSDEHDRSVSVTVGYFRRLQPDLNLAASATYTRTFASPLFGASKTYDLDAGLIYLVNSTTDLRADYRFSRGEEDGPFGRNLTENVIQVALLKRF